MLAKTRRLSALEVRQVLAKGTPARKGGVSMRALAVATPGKAAMVVSSKVAKSATVRNRLRRKGYAALPDPLPRAHMVFFIQDPEFKTADILSLCLTRS